MKNMIDAPWPDDIVAALNRFQHSPSFHPFTCARCRDELGVEGVLEATTDGWTCPTCDYTQTWAWAWMADMAPPEV